MDQAEAKHLFEPAGDFQCLHEFIPAARAKLSDHIWHYLVGAAETETTMRRNRLALDSLALRPRVCVDVSKVEPGTTLFGRTLRMPVILAPEDWAVWLGESAGDAAAMMRPCAEGLLDHWPVSSAVGNVRNQGAELPLPQGAELPLPQGAALPLPVPASSR